MLAQAALLFALAFALFQWRIEAPSAWRDEAVTLGMAGRPLTAIWATTDRVDLVHAFYYALAHLLHEQLPGLTTLRLLSALFCAGAVALCVVLAAQLGLPGWARVGTAAAVAVNPLASAQAQQARPYALVMLITMAATVALVRALHGDHPAAWGVYATDVPPAEVAPAVGGEAEVWLVTRAQAGPNETPQALRSCFAADSDQVFTGFRVVRYHRVCRST